MDINAATLSLLVSLAYNGAQTNTGEIDAGYMLVRWPNGVCQRWDVRDYQHKIPKAEAWFDAGVQFGLTQQYFQSQGWIADIGAANPALCSNYAGFSTHGFHPAIVAAPVPPVVTPPPVVPPPSVTTVSAPAGTLTDAAGGIWTFGAATSSGGNVIVLNGTATTGFGKQLTLSGGKVYTLTLQNTWFVWTGTNWLSQATAPQ